MAACRFRKDSMKMQIELFSIEDYLIPNLMMGDPHCRRCVYQTTDISGDWYICEKAYVLLKMGLGSSRYREASMEYLDRVQTQTEFEKAAIEILRNYREKAGLNA